MKLNSVMIINNSFWYLFPKLFILKIRAILILKNLLNKISKITSKLMKINYV